MRKYTQRALKQLAHDGIAHDITNADAEYVLSVAGRCEVIGYSTGIYGANGALLKDRKSGDAYTIIARNSNLFRVI
nr:MAG TPA: hypothetical protein [Caudoviricetes sp.]